MTSTTVSQISIVKKILVVCLIIMIMITGIIAVEYVKSMNFDVGLEECLCVCLIHGYAMDE